MRTHTKITVANNSGTFQAVALSFPKLNGETYVQWIARSTFDGKPYQGTSKLSQVTENADQSNRGVQ
jgi:hypothetical protein